jgi:hypothetical protein
MADSGGWAALANSTSHLPALGMSMIGLRERNEDRDLTRGLMEQRLGMQEETAKQTNLLHQGQLAAAEAKIPKFQQPMDPTIVDMSKAASLNKWGPTITKIMDPFLEKIKGVAAESPHSTYGDALSAASSFYPEENERMIAEGSKLLASGKLAGTTEEKKVAEFVNFLHYDKEKQDFLNNGVFKTTAESIKEHQENSKSAINEVRNTAYGQRLEDRLASNERNVDARIAAAGAKGGAAGKYQFVGTDADGKPLVLDVHTGKIAPASDAKIGAKPSTAKPKDPSMPLKRLDEMVKAAGSSPDPSAIEIIGRLADEHGMEYAPVVTKNKILPDSTEWKLMKKGGASGQPDKFGYVMGEVRQGHKYIGNDKWEPVK